MRPADARLLRRAGTAGAGGARGYLITSAVLGLVTAGLIIAQAALLARLLATAALGIWTAALTGPLIALAGVAAARAAATWAGETAALRAAAAVKSGLRRALIRHSLRLGPAWLTGQRPGSIATLAGRGLDALDPYFAGYLPQLVLAAVVPVAVLATVTATDWISGLVIALTLPLVPVFAVLTGRSARARARGQWQRLDRLGGHFLDLVQGLPTLKAYGRATPQDRVIARACGEYRIAVMATLRVAFLSALVLELSAALATALVAVEAGLRLLYGHLDYRAALLVLLLTPEAYLPLRGLAAQYHASAEGAAVAERVFQLLDTPPGAASAGPPGDPQPAPAAGSRSQSRPQAATGRSRRVMPDLRRDAISLREVTVGYPGRDVPALDRLSLVIEAGELIMVTGPSGAGKSTLLQLLLGFVRPASGTVLAGRSDLTAVPTAAWRRQVAWVPQQPRLFAGSVAGNIALGRPGAAMAAIERAAQTAGAAGFIEALPDGYRTRLGERAALSAGQRQQLALARAFLLEAPLLLLDEPAAHLDPASAAHVLSGLRGRDGPGAGQTVVLVSHHPVAGARIAGVGAAGVTGARVAGAAGAARAARAAGNASDTGAAGAVGTGAPVGATADRVICLHHGRLASAGIDAEAGAGAGAGEPTGPLSPAAAG